MKEVEFVNEEWMRVHRKRGKSADFSGTCQLVHLAFTPGDHLGPPGSTSDNSVVSEHCFSDLAPPYQGCSSRLTVMNNASLARFVAACTRKGRIVHLWITFGSEQMKLSEIAHNVTKDPTLLESGYQFWRHICSFVLCVTSYVLHMKGKVTMEFPCSKGEEDERFKTCSFLTFLRTTVLCQSVLIEYDVDTAYQWAPIKDLRRWQIISSDNQWLPQLDSLMGFAKKGKRQRTMAFDDRPVPHHCRALLAMLSSPPEACDIAGLTDDEPKEVGLSHRTPKGTAWKATPPTSLKRGRRDLVRRQLTDLPLAWKTRRS